MEFESVVSQPRTLQNLAGFSLSPAESEEVHVLAVDDSLIDRKVIERLLKVLACKVTAVDSGLRALQFLGLDQQKMPSESNGFVHLKVDLIIIDYCMPGMTGYELLKKIKESSTFRETPVVIMSFENILPRIDRCLEEGAEDFIVKPGKLSDVKRLKNYMTTKEVKDGRGGGGVGGMKKRKLPDNCDVSSSPPCSSSSTPSSSPLSSPTPSASSSLSVIESPIRRLKMTSTD